MQSLYLAYFITWTTYGSWLPGDWRGWRKAGEGSKTPQPLLEDWCRDQMVGEPIVLNIGHREKVEAVCRQHATIRQWSILAINVRSNHVHVVVSACSHKPQTVRDQLKANATRVLRQEPDAILAGKVWTRGGDCELIDNYDDLQRVLEYVVEEQDHNPK